MDIKKIFANNLTKSYLIVFGVILAVFTILTFLITDAGLDDGPRHYLFVLLTSLFTITGPLTGAISRGAVFGLQNNCCLKFSLMLMMYCAPFLFAGIVVQFFRFPKHKWLNILRMALWIIGWLVWFMGGILSFGHALS